VGDPFTEKLLMEACLELMKGNSIISIQDMGAAGLTSSSVEMASKGDLGIELYLDMIPCREDNMTPYEMMLSESQERMLIILEDGKEKEAKKIFEKWDLDFVVIGKTTNTNKLTLKFKDIVVGEIPVDALATKAPIYDRKWVKTKLPEKKVKIKDLKKTSLEDALLKLLSSPNQSNKKWITDQFDQMVMADTIQKSGSDAAIIRIHKKEKAIAVTVDSSANYCKAHPYTGGKQIVCENWRNLISVGAKPIAITNCLNFGNPENAEVMGEFAECVLGIKEACEFLDYPVVSGNVSLYNGTNKRNIYPTPVIGGVGLINNINNKTNQYFKKDGNFILQIGKNFGQLSQSVFLEEIYSITDGPPPEINLSNEKNNGLAVLKLINDNLVSSTHDISSGGLLLALAEMTFQSGFGVKLDKPKNLSNLIEYYFSEDQGRYIIEVEPNNLSKIKKILIENNIFNEKIGIVQKDYLEVYGELKIHINDLYKTNSRWYNNY
jgi:phosphoribosylformylglycinamidine synthase II